MAPTAPTASARGAATTFTLEDLARVLMGAINPEPPPPAEVVTVGETSDIKLDRLLYCPDCLDPRMGPSWGTHYTHRIIEDPEKPGQPKRIATPWAHPRSTKILSYDQRAARDGLESGKLGKQCLQCGAKLHGVAA